MVVGRTTLLSMGPVIVVTRISRRLAAVVGGLLIVAMVPGTAWAPKVFHRLNVAGTCTATFGTTTSGSGTFAGGLELSHFDVVGDALTVTGVLSGNCAKDSATWVDLGPQSVSLAVTAPTASCAEFVFTVGGSLDLGQNTVTLSPVTTRIQASKSTEKRLCAVDRLFDAGRLGPVSHLLNTLI